MADRTPAARHTPTAADGPPPVAGRTPPVALTVAGSDSGGGAGIQADLKTFAAHRVYGCSVVSAVTAQNTRGVTDTLAVPAGMLAAQLDAVLDDLPVRAAKTGMLADAAAVRAVADRADRLPYLVVDPVLVATSGDRLAGDGALAALRDVLLPRATVLTPNLHEAGALLGRRLCTPDDVRDAAVELADHWARYAVVTGGHLAGAECPDAVAGAGRVGWLSAPRVATVNTHGTGCTFSAAVTARLAAGAEPASALVEAKRYVTRALRAAAGWRLGAGPGPVDHDPDRPLPDDHADRPDHADRCDHDTRSGHAAARPRPDGDHDPKEFSDDGSTQGVPAG